MALLRLDQLEDVVVDQWQGFKNKDKGISRAVDMEKYLKTKQITVISGIRRSGKSTLLAQFSKNYENYYYINFEDERLVDFKVRDFANLMLVFKMMYSARVIFMDEVQNIKGWERFVRRLYEEGFKIFVTGSNAKLLSSELATHLTARYFKIELYPFSFVEFLNFNKVDVIGHGSDSKVEIIKYFDEYARTGGFPEMVKYQDVEFLKRIYEDVLYKDLLVRLKIRDVEAFKQLAGYLFFTIYKYDYSLKKQFISDKKIYAIDNGLRNAVSFAVSDDRGRLLENMIFLELKRRGYEVYFFKGKGECDFVLK